MRKPEVIERQRIQSRKYSDEELIAILISRAESLGRTPSHREMRKPTTSTYIERFGSFSAAVMLAGLMPNIAAPKEYFENSRHIIPLSRRFEVLHRDGFRCQYCGGTPQDGYVLHVDHRQPRSNGGSDDMQNLVTACFLCNNGKSNREVQVRVSQLAEEASAINVKFSL